MYSRRQLGMPLDGAPSSQLTIFSIPYLEIQIPAQCTIPPLNPDFRPFIVEMVPTSHGLNRIKAEVV